MAEIKNKMINIIWFLMFAILGTVLYSQTLQIPWLLDDVQNILENPVVRSLDASITNIFGERGFVYVTFAVNYWIGGMEVFGFHAVNIAIHVLASWIVFLLAKRAFYPVIHGTATDLSYPVFSTKISRSQLCALATGLIFLLHPLQTQAVNYIVQRMVCLSALLFLSALYCYCRSLECSGMARGIGDKESCYLKASYWYFPALVFAVLAIMTKQNTAVLPATLLLFDWLVLNQGRRPPLFGRRLLLILPFFLISALFAYIQVGKDDVVLKEAGSAQYWSRAEETSSARNLVKNIPVVKSGELPPPAKLVRPPENLQLIYFATELSVLWLYIRLLLFPYAQTFDYGYPLVGEILTLHNASAGIGLLSLLLLAFWLRKRKPLVSFGIFWFFVALSIESTIIPLDAAVEHRLYLPMFGFAVAIVSAFSSFYRMRAAAYLLVFLLLFYGVATWKRNLIWSDPIIFGINCVEMAPHNQRNHLALATAYADALKWTDAERVLRGAIPLRPNYHIPYDNLGTALMQQGKLSEARAYYSLAASINPDYPNAILNYGLVSLLMGDMPAALRSLSRLKEMGSPLSWQLGAQFTIPR